jgi:hypothetical protein
MNLGFSLKFGGAIACTVRRNHFQAILQIAANEDAPSLERIGVVLAFKTGWSQSGRVRLPAGAVSLTKDKEG